MGQYSRKLANGTFWQYKFNYNGKTYRSKSNFKTKSEAKKAESILIAELSDSKTILTDEFLLKDLISERLRYVETMKSKKYYRENLYYINLLLKHIDGNTKVTDISKNDISKILLEFSNKQKRDGHDNYAVNSMLRIIKALFSYGIEFMQIKMVNPCFKLQQFSVNQELKYIPTDDEINAVLKLCLVNQKMLILFVRDTYCRINEALNLTFGDIGEDFVVLYTRKSKNGNKMFRKVPKPACLNFTIQASDKSARVFGDWSETPRFLEKKIKQLNQQTWSWHNLRHRGASLMSKQGIPLFDIMQRLGHQNLETTQKYLQSL